MKQRKRETANIKKEYRIAYWLPVYAVLLVLPFITRYCFYPSRFYEYPFGRTKISRDIDLYAKHAVFLCITAYILVLLFYFWYKKKQKKYNWNLKRDTRFFFLLGSYIVLAFLSSVFSINRYAAFCGSNEQFESFFAWSGYLLLTIYICFLIKTEKEIRHISIVIVISMILFACYGILQYTGHDLLQYDWYKELILPKNAQGDIWSTSSETNVSLSAYNSNYAGVLLAMLSALLLGLVLTEKSTRNIVFGIILLAGLITSLIGTGSEAGMLVFGVSALLAILVLLKRLRKYWYFLIPVVTGMALSGLLFIQYQNYEVWNSIERAIIVEREKENPLDYILTKEDGVEIKYKDVVFTTQLDIMDGDFLFAITEENGVQFPLVLSEDRTHYMFDHEILGDVILMPGLLDETIPVFVLHMNGADWMFAKRTNGYYYVNSGMKLEILDKTERFGFEGYEKFISGRGLIWSQTLPLLKKTILLGSGSNTFAYIYPQNNYVDMLYYNNRETVTTRPHCMYLQIAVESGVVSLIALVVFWAWYLLQSVGIYFKSKLETMTERVGFACFLAVFVYLVCGLTNDSMVTVAPVFWCIMGLGLATNRMVKEQNK